MPRLFEVSRCKRCKKPVPRNSIICGKCVGFLEPRQCLRCKVPTANRGRICGGCLDRAEAIAAGGVDR